MKKKVLMTSILTIALCLTLIVGSTYALFTSGNDVNVAITAGKLEVIATIDDNLVTRSLEDADTVNRQGMFSNGGYAELTDDKTLDIAYMTPGDVVEFDIAVENNSNVALKYRVRAVSAVNTGVDLADALVITIIATDTLGVETTYVLQKDATTQTYTATSTWIDVSWQHAADDNDDTTHEAHIGDSIEIDSIHVIVEFPNGNPNNTYDVDGTTVLEYGDNYYQEATASLTFTVEAVQANGVDTNGNYILP